VDKQEYKYVNNLSCAYHNQDHNASAYQFIKEMSPSTSASKVVLRSLYRNLLRSSSIFDKNATYASLIHRSGIYHDWDECINRLERKRSSTSPSASNDDTNKNNKETNIPRSWAKNLTRSYTDLQTEYENRKEYFRQRFGTDDMFDDEDEDIDTGDLVTNTSSNYKHQEEYSISEDPKYVLFRQLLCELFTSTKTNDNNGITKADNKWPKQWPINEEGYYESRAHQVPLMKFPSQIKQEGGLGLREMIQREFRAPSVEERLSKSIQSSSNVKSEIMKENDVPSTADDKEMDEVYPSSSYIDNEIRIQTAFLALQELNRKQAWVEQISLPPSYSNQLRLIQAAKGVRKLDDDDTDEKINKSLKSGTYLIAHPLMAGYFAKSVIVLLDHSDGETKKEEEDNDDSKEGESSGGTYGLIINRLALKQQITTSSSSSVQLDILRQQWEEKQSKLGDEQAVGSADIDTFETTTPIDSTATTTQSTLRPISLLQAINDTDLPESVQMAFGDSHVRDGGPVNLSLQMIHRKQKSEQDDTNVDDEKESQKESKVGGTELGSDVNKDSTILFGGDVIDASYRVTAGTDDVDDYSFIIGASCWSPGQLEHEIQRGCWLPFKGPASMALTGMCEHNYIASSEENGNDSESKLSMFPPRPNHTTTSVAGSATTGESSQRPKARPDLWLSIMCALGEEEADLAYMMLDTPQATDSFGDSCDNFER